FNEQIARSALEHLGNSVPPGSQPIVFAVGVRGDAALRGLGQETAKLFSLPGTAAGINTVVRELLVAIQPLIHEQGVTRLFLFHNRSLAGSSNEQCTLQLLPVDSAWLSELESRRWPTNVLPT